MSTATAAAEIGDLLTLNEAAGLLRVSTRTVRQWSSHGVKDQATGEVFVLKRVKIGRSVRYRREALAEFIADCSRG